MDFERLGRSFDLFSRLVFASAASGLVILALSLSAYAVYDFIRGAAAGEPAGLTALNGIGYIVISIAVFEVAKYLFDEDVVRGRQMRVASETRKSLTRFISTIAIAIFLEGLVIVFQVRNEVEKLVYPTFLLIGAIAMVVGLGVFQRLSITVEAAVEDIDRQKEAERDEAQQG